jgi:hypothetical protein
MAQVVIIKLSSAGSDVSNFDIYSDADGFTTPFMEDISKDVLLAGFTSSVVPDGATQIRVLTTDLCSTDATVTIDTSDPQPPTPVTNYWTLVPCEVGYPTYTTTIEPPVANQRYVITGTPDIYYTWDNSSPTTFESHPYNSSIQIVTGQSGCPALCYIYEYINYSSNTIDVNGTLCSGGSYSLPVLPNGEGTTSCIQELSQSTIDAYSALGLILTRGSLPCN